MAVLVRRATVTDLRHVVAHWRDCDRQEILGCWWNDDPDSYARVAEQILASENVVGLWRCALVDGTPAAIWGAVEEQPKVWTVFAFGTDQWPNIVLSITKHIKRVLIPVLRGRGANVAECWALASHSDACAWLERLGAKAMCELPRGKNGDRYRLYAWVR